MWEGQQGIVGGATGDCGSSNRVAKWDCGSGNRGSWEWQQRIVGVAAGVVGGAGVGHGVGVAGGDYDVLHFMQWKPQAEVLLGTQGGDDTR